MNMLRPSRDPLVRGVLKHFLLGFITRTFTMQSGATAASPKLYSHGVPRLNKSISFWLDPGTFLFASTVQRHIRPLLVLGKTIKALIRQKEQTAQSLTHKASESFLPVTDTVTHLDVEPQTLEYQFAASTRALP